MDGRGELLAYLGSALTTIVVLFGAQYWYASYLDVAVVHGDRDMPMDAKLAAVRDDEHKKLSSGALPIDRAKQALAQRGRLGFPRITPKVSEDLGAMSGWINKPGFAAYQPRQPQAPAAAPGDALAEPGAVQAALAGANVAPALAGVPVATPAAPAAAPAAAPVAPAPGKAQP